MSHAYSHLFGRLPFVRTDGPDHFRIVVTRISLLIETIQPDQSNPKYYARRRWFLSKNRLGKASRVKMTAPAMAWPVTSDTGKTPAEYHVFLPPPTLNSPLPQPLVYKQGLILRLFFSAGNLTTWNPMSLPLLEATSGRASIWSLFYV